MPSKTLYTCCSFIPHTPLSFINIKFALSYEAISPSLLIYLYKLKENLTINQINPIRVWWSRTWILCLYLLNLYDLSHKIQWKQLNHDNFSKLFCKLYCYIFFHDPYPTLNNLAMKQFSLKQVCHNFCILFLHWFTWTKSDFSWKKDWHRTSCVGHF